MSQIVYVANPESQQILVWRLAQQGALVLLQTVDVPGQVQPMAIHPAGTHLYVGVRPTFGVISYRIADDGTLQQVGMAPLPGSPTHISTDQQGRYLFAASYSGNNVTVSRMDENGIVMAPHQQINELPAPHSANIDPTNTLLLIPCLKEDRIRVYQLNGHGELVAHQQPALHSANGAGPRHMAFHPSGLFAYCVNELTGTVDLFAITEQGRRYTLKQTLSVLPADYSGTRWAADIHVTPNGRFLYVSERASSILTLFTLSQDGSEMTLAGHQHTEAQPRGFNIDHTGRFVITTGQQSDHIALYAIDQQQGQLAELARYPVGKGAMWVSILAR